MIISDNKTPPLSEFRALMKKTDWLLNQEAQGRDSYYVNRNGTDLEKDVHDVLSRAAKGTSSGFIGFSLLYPQDFGIVSDSHFYTPTGNGKRSAYAFHLENSTCPQGYRCRELLGMDQVS